MLLDSLVTFGESKDDNKNDLHVSVVVVVVVVVDTDNAVDDKASYSYVDGCFLLHFYGCY